MIEPSPTCYIHIPLPNRNLQSYCWWKTSCTSWGAHRVLIAAVQGFFHQPYVKKAEPNLWDLGYWYPKLWGIFLFNFGVVPKLCFIYDICTSWSMKFWRVKGACLPPSIAKTNSFPLRFWHIKLHLVPGPFLGGFRNYLPTNGNPPKTLQIHYCTTLSLRSCTLSRCCVVPYLILYII